MLSVHNRRQGMQGVIDRWILGAAVEIQQLVPFFQQRNVSLLKPGNLVVSGFASKGDMPDGKVDRFRILGTDTDGNIDSCKHDGPLELCRWQDAQTFVCGTSPAWKRGVTVDPTGRVFYVFPALQDDELLEVSWRGVKRRYANNEPVLFDNSCSQAVSEYVLARISRLVDKDLASAQSFDRTYHQLMRGIHSLYHGRQFVETMEGADIGVYGTIVVSAIVSGYDGASFSGIGEILPNYALPSGQLAYWSISQITDSSGAVLTSLVGWSFTVVVKATKDTADSSALFTLTNGSGVTVTGGSATAVSSSAQTASMAAGVPYYYSVKASAPDGSVTLLEEGTVTRSA